MTRAGRVSPHARVPSSQEQATLVSVTEPPAAPVIPTRRLVLRPWRADEAAVMRQLWSERDPRVPEHRRIDAAGEPSVETIRAQILRPRAPLGLLAAQERQTGRVVGCCGLVEADGGCPGEAEIAFELLQSAWGQGLATEAGAAIVEWARQHDLFHLRATVWDWNLASQRVLTKLGFSPAGVASVDPARGTTLLYAMELRPGR